MEDLKGRDCYAGLDLSSTSDITAFVMVFPPLHEGDKYIVYRISGCHGNAQPACQAGSCAV